MKTLCLGPYAEGPSTSPSLTQRLRMKKSKSESEVWMLYIPLKSGPLETHSGRPGGFFPPWFPFLCMVSLTCCRLTEPRGLVTKAATSTPLCSQLTAQRPQPCGAPLAGGAGGLSRPRFWVLYGGTFALSSPDSRGWGTGAPLAGQLQKPGSIAKRHLHVRLCGFLAGVTLLGCPFHVCALVKTWGT